MKNLEKVLLGIGAAVAGGIVGFFLGDKASDHREKKRRDKVEEEELLRQEKLNAQAGQRSSRKSA